MQAEPVTDRSMSGFLPSSIKRETRLKGIVKFVETAVKMPLLAASPIDCCVVCTYDQANGELVVKMLDNRFKYIVFVAVSLLTASVPQQAQCQEYTAEIPDNAYQTDITNGMAEQNGMYAIRNAKPVRRSNSQPQQFLQGYASQDPSQMNQGFIMQNDGYAQSGYVPLQGQMQMQGPVQGQIQMQDPMLGQAQMQGPMLEQADMQQPMQGQVQDQAGGLFGGATQMITQTTGFKVTSTQVVGAIGAAMMLNYVTQGGAQSVMNTMGTRGWSGRRHTFGSGGMVFH